MMLASHPFVEDYGEETTDRELVAQAVAGDRDSLQRLVLRHQAWIYNIALRFVWEPVDAQDATQEILIKLVTRLNSFREESAFRTWLYRIAVNHMLNSKRARVEQQVSNFACYGQSLQETTDSKMPNAHDIERQVLLAEVKMACTVGMLLCLDREQRLIFVLGEIFAADHNVGADILQITASNFRQKLSRSKKQLYGFLQGRCSLVDDQNPCSCRRKTRGFIQQGIVDPKSLRFAEDYQKRVEQVAPIKLQLLEEAADGTHLFRRQPFLQPDFPEVLKQVLSVSV